MKVRPFQPEDAPAAAALSARCARSESDFVLNPCWEDEEELAAECQKQVEAAVERYLAIAPRAPETMFDHLYAELPRGYAGQRRELSGGSDA